MENHHLERLWQARGSILYKKKGQSGICGNEESGGQEPLMTGTRAIELRGQQAGGRE